MKRRHQTSLLIFIAVVWAVAAISLGVLLLSGYQLPFASQSSSHSASTPEGIAPKARVDVIDVGQGSSLLVKLYGDYTKSILIDAGEQSSSDEVCHAIQEAGLSSIDIIVITHPHTDHFGGAIDVLQRYKVSELWLPDITEENTPTNSSYEKFLDALEQNGCRVLLKSKPETLAVSENCYISVLDGFIKSPDDLNNASLCLRLDIDDISFLITGDAETELEDVLLENNADVDADIFIAGHHGSSSSNGRRFLNAVSPVASVISAGRDNEYGHPDPDVYERLASFGNVYRTDINGTVTFFTDGKTVSVSAYKIADAFDAGR